MPGFVNTPNNDKWFNSFADPSAQRAKIYDMHPVKRIGNPEDIGALCVFLCSSHAGYITGTTILVDGGRGALMQD
jgi:NAD(P)-dependent dehydrogenase (short-subunit alcohol dehydrogenase family)